MTTAKAGEAFSRHLGDLSPKGRAKAWKLVRDAFRYWLGGEGRKFETLQSRESVELRSGNQSVWVRRRGNEVEVVDFALDRGLRERVAHRAVKALQKGRHRGYFAELVRREREPRSVFIERPEMVRPQVDPATQPARWSMLAGLQSPNQIEQSPYTAISWGVDDNWVSVSACSGAPSTKSILDAVAAETWNLDVVPAFTISCLGSGSAVMTTCSGSATASTITYSSGFVFTSVALSKKSR